MFFRMFGFSSLQADLSVVFLLLVGDVVLCGVSVCVWQQAGPGLLGPAGVTVSLMPCPQSQGRQFRETSQIKIDSENRSIDQQV